MGGGSIITPVECGSSPGDQLYLSMADGAEFVGEIPDLVILQIKLYIQIEEIEDLLGHQT